MGKVQKQKEQNAPSIIERKTGRLIQEESMGRGPFIFCTIIFLGEFFLK